MSDEAFTVIAALGCTLAGGALYGATMFAVDRIAKALRRRAERRRLRALPVDDTWENSPWRDM